MAIGRNLNMRNSDSSSILNSYEKHTYIDRMGKSDTFESAIASVSNQKRASVFILHQSLGSINILRKVAPKVKILNIRRHPVDLAYSWIMRGWGERYGKDPLSFEIVSSHGGSFFPYFASDWKEDYIAGNKFDRVVQSIIHLSEEEGGVIESKKYDIHCIYYDDLINQPKKVMSDVCTFFGRSPHESMFEAINKEVRDVNFLAERELKKDYIKRHLTLNKTLVDRFFLLAEKYEKNIFLYNK